MIKKIFLAFALIGSTTATIYAQNEEIVEIDDFEEEGDLIPAPEFTLRDINGKEVSLSSFQGDWVVLDFWGSWCRYCVEGIPNMKEAYNKYHSQGLEILGIDCGETPEEWKAAVAKYELPWINLYNPEPKKAGLCETYGVRGFPTKVIINPEGYIYEVFLGEDPEFYKFLDLIFNP